MHKSVLLSSSLLLTGFCSSVFSLSVWLGWHLSVWHIYLTYFSSSIWAPCAFYFSTRRLFFSIGSFRCCNGCYCCCFLQLIFHLVFVLLLCDFVYWLCLCHSGNFTKFKMGLKLHRFRFSPSSWQLINVLDEEEKDERGNRMNAYDRIMKQPNCVRIIFLLLGFRNNQRIKGTMHAFFLFEIGFLVVSVSSCQTHTQPVFFFKPTIFFLHNFSFHKWTVIINVQKCDNVMLNWMGTKLKIKSHYNLKCLVYQKKVFTEQNE